MALLNSSAAETESKLRKPLMIERRPLMLKDFLRDDSNSCSSNGFRSFPRRSCYPTVRNILEMDLEARDSNSTSRLLRSRSKAASTTISALQKASEAVINAVKLFPFSSINPHSSSLSKQGFLTRSLSRKLLRRSFWRKTDKEEREIRIRVTVKDIIRWRSFRDLVEENQKPLDFSSSPPPPYTTTTTSSTSHSNSNSWCDYGFESDYLQCSSCNSEYSGENEAEEGKKYSPEKKMISKREGVADSEDSMAATTYTVVVDAKEESQYEEKEQFSPVSVLDFPFEEDEETSSFQQSLASIGRSKKKLMQKIRRFESLAQLEPIDLEKWIAVSDLDEPLESPRNYSSISTHSEKQEDEETQKAKEKAWELLKLIKATSSVESSKSNVDLMLLDFLRDGILDRNQNTQLLKMARDWMNGNNYHGLLEYGLKDYREACVRDMEMGGRWMKLDKEQGELAFEMEIGVLGDLLDELLLDLLS
ncbi:hypothetical protein HHK36_027820 [Tetracentron sinense]|uniref:DUF4378 domain-containing protein n=1 Tax=Tetracentron sinense TaxID=13715 RepID=A0A835D3W6_TETSI|nr:hypothetical protein HHK36_027820 [Tetracentron sinense]